MCLFDKFQKKFNAWMNSALQPVKGMDKIREGHTKNSLRTLITNGPLVQLVRPPVL